MASMILASAFAFLGFNT